MIVGGIVGALVYVIVILLLKAIKPADVTLIEHFVNKTGPLKKYLVKIVKIIRIYLEH